MCLVCTRLVWFMAPPVPVTRTPPVDWHARRLTESSFPWETWPLPQHRDTYRSRFSRGHTCLGLFVDGTLAHLSWIASDMLTIDELRRTWTISPDARCIYDVVTLPQFRRRGMFHHALLLVPYLLRPEGVRAVWIYADSTNTASVEAIVRAGYVERSRTTRCGVGGFTLLRRGTFPEMG